MEIYKSLRRFVNIKKDKYELKINVYILSKCARRLLIFHESPEISNYHTVYYIPIFVDPMIPSYKNPRGQLLTFESKTRAGSLRKQRKRGNFRWWPSAKGRLSVKKIHPWIPHKETPDTPGSYLKDFKEPRLLPGEFRILGPRPRFLIKP